MGGIGGEVVELPRVGLEVVQLPLHRSFPGQRRPLGVAVARGADAAPVRRAPRFGEDRVLPGARGVQQNRAETRAFEAARRRDAGEVDEGRVEVDQFDQRLRTGADLRAGSTNDERNARRLFELGVLAPQSAVFAEMEAVVAGEHHHGGLVQPEFPQGVEQQSDVPVDHRDGRMVGGDGLPDLLPGVLRVVRVARERRQWNVVPVVGGRVRWRDRGDRVAPEIAGRGDPGQVRLVESGRDEERARTLVAQQLDYPQCGPAVRRFAVVLAGGAPGERGAAHPTERRERLRPAQPGCGAFVPGVVPYRGAVLPRQVVLARAGVLRDVPGHRILVSAVRDLADACREVTVLPEMFRQHRDGPEGLARPREVAVDTRGRRPAPRQERGARRIADRVVGVSAVEADALGGEPVEVGRHGRRVDAVGAEGDVQVVGDDEQDVRVLSGSVRGDAPAYREEPHEQREQHPMSRSRHPRHGASSGQASCACARRSRRGCTRRASPASCRRPCRR